MYIDLWGWFREYARQARINGDHQRAQFDQIAYRGWQYRRNAQPEQAYQEFNKGVQLAQHLKEPCWELFFQYWCAEMLFYHTTDQKAALDYIMPVATRAYQEQYIHCPVRSRVYFIVTDLYYAIDFYSYHEKIREMLDYLQEEIPIDQDTALRARHIRAEFEMEFEHYSAARDIVLEYMPEAESNDFRMRTAYNLLRKVAYAQGDIVLALQYSHQTEDYAKRTQSQGEIATQKLWQSVYHSRLGNEQAAPALYRAGIELHERYQIPLWPRYYSSVCEYLELNGKTGEALKLRQKQYENIHQYNSIYMEAGFHLDYCTLLGRIASPLLPDALKSADALQHKMGDASLYLQRLQKIYDGMYYDYEWQRP